MKPRDGSEQGDWGAVASTASSFDCDRNVSAPGRGPDGAAGNVDQGETHVDGVDLATWLDALDQDSSYVVHGEPDEGCPASDRHGAEADELVLALATLATLAPAARPSRRPPPRDVRPDGPAKFRGKPELFDRNVLAERMLLEGQRHAVEQAVPDELLLAHVGTAALSAEVMRRLLSGLAGFGHGSDEAAVAGPGERGLLALLTLELYAADSRKRHALSQAVPEIPQNAAAPSMGDDRLRQTLALPHEATRPLGERRPRGSPTN